MRSIVLLLSIIAIYPLYATTTVTVKKTELTRINHSIENVKATLSREQALRDNNQKKLKNTEITITHLLNQLSTTKQKLQKEENNWAFINQQKNKYEQLIEEQETDLEQHIRAAYMLPYAPFLKLLLGPTNASTMDRMRIYYHYLTQSQAEMIRKLNQDIQNLHLYQQKSEHQSHLLLHLQTEQQTQHQELERFKNDRQHIVDTINTNIVTQKQRLAILMSNKQRLEQTLLQLQHSVSAFSSSTEPFGRLTGRLFWPTRGKIVTNYGSPIYHSELRWTGIVIQASLDAPVHSIASGKVIFADWMAGYGLLLIIDHGDGYMSLYGRNHNVYHAVGDVVPQGEIIARVGTSGGYEKPGLYFAIRHNAQPEDPRRWCKTMP